ncbi:ABC transporter ATP-binding protein [Carboxylicivirga sp. N1Y90]|uniref:ABC transporter ATP-binding protein n=1 Tax=Carboxylicivirga fragile TaxID=3417571 RepID=UPI003D33F898|nr:ABC transporter ATP-binding protein [Marinilabiliaceae bacterium N1Y90]
MIHTRNLTKVHRNGGVERKILQNVNVDIEAGDFVGLLGPSGSGKSTLVNMFGLIELPTSGELLFMGHDITRLKERQRVNLRRGSIGFVFQDFGLIEELSVFENIELPLQYLGYKRKDRVMKVNSILEQMSVSHLKGFFPKHLTGLQKQLVALARAVVIDPSVILADEPTGCLNSNEGSSFMEVLYSLHEKGTTIVMATHSAYEAQKTQRVVQLYDGHIITDSIKGDL